MPTLKQAQQDPKAMNQFVSEHKGEQIESADFDNVFCSMTGQGKSKVIQATSSKDVGGDYT